MKMGQLTPPVGEGDHTIGPADATVTLVEYGDFECEYCGMAYPIVHALQRRLGPQLRFVFRNFPLKESHPHAQHAAEVAEAAGVRGRFWEMHDTLYEHQRQLTDADLLRYVEQLGLDADDVARELEAGVYARRVRDQFRSGVRSGVNGTPTFFVNGDRYDGDWTNEDTFLRALRDVADAETDVRA